MAKTKAQGLTVALDPAPKAGEAITLLTQAKGLSIVDRPSHEAALTFIKGAKALKREIEEHYAKIKKPLNDARNTILDMEKTHLAPVNEAITVADRVTTTYVNEQRRREQEEAERVRRAAEAEERARREAEAAKAEEAALALEASSNGLSEREQKFVALWVQGYGTASAKTTALCAINAGYKDGNYGERLLAQPKIQQAITDARRAAAIRKEAEAKQAAPIIVETAPVPSEIGSVSGTSLREYWRCESVDLKALVLAAAEDIQNGGGSLLLALEPNMVYLNGQARDLKTMFERVHPYAKASKTQKVAG